MPVPSGYALDDNSADTGVKLPAGYKLDQPEDRSVAAQAQQRLSARGLTAADVKAGKGVTPSNFSTLGELQNPANFPTTGQVLAAAGKHAAGAVTSMLPRAPKDAIEAITSLDPTGSVRSTVDAVRSLPSTYHEELKRGNTPLSAGIRSATSLVPGGSTLTGLTAPASAAAHGRPVSKAENLAAAGGVGDIGGTVAIGATLHKAASSRSPAAPAALPDVWSGPEPSGSMPVYGEPSTTPPSILARGAEYAIREAANKIPFLGTHVGDALKGSIARSNAAPPMLGEMDLSRPAAFGAANVEPIRPRAPGPEFDARNPVMESGAGGPVIVDPNSAMPVQRVSASGTDFNMQPSPARAPAQAGTGTQPAALAEGSAPVNTPEQINLAKHWLEEVMAAGSPPDLMNTPRLASEPVYGYAPVQPLIQPRTIGPEYNPRTGEDFGTRAVGPRDGPSSSFIREPPTDLPDASANPPAGRFISRKNIPLVGDSPSSSIGVSPRVAYLNSQMSSSTPAPMPTASPAAPAPAPSSNVRRSRPGQPLEFPAPGSRDENDALFMQRTSEDGKPLQFPVPVNPSTLLPDHFVNARNVRYGGPLADYQVQGEPKSTHKAGEIDANGTHGLYGGRFEQADKSETPNTVLIPASDANNPQAYAHEVSHAIYDKDLTPAQRQAFGAKVSAAFDAVNAQQASSSVPLVVAESAREVRNGSAKERNDAIVEVFGQLGAQYLLNPSAFQAKYPDWYGMFKQFYNGREYIQGARSNEAGSGEQLGSGQAMGGAQLQLQQRSSHLKQVNP